MKLRHIKQRINRRARIERAVRRRAFRRAFDSGVFAQDLCLSIELRAMDEADARPLLPAGADPRPVPAAPLRAATPSSRRLSPSEIESLRRMKKAAIAAGMAVAKLRPTST